MAKISEEDVKEIYERISNGGVVYLTEDKMKQLDDYYSSMNDAKVLDNYISDDHMGDGVYKVYIHIKNN